MRKSSLVCKCNLGGVMDSKWLVNGFVDKDDEYRHHRSLVLKDCKSLNHKIQYIFSTHSEKWKQVNFVAMV